MSVTLATAALAVAMLSMQVVSAANETLGNNVTCIPAANTTTAASDEPDGTLTGEGVFVIVAVAAMVVAMALNLIGSLAALFLTSTLFTVTGIITSADLYSGFTNRGMLVIGMMFVIVNPISHLPAARGFVTWLLKPAAVAAGAEAPTGPASSVVPRAKLCFFAWIVSPFLGNVPHCAVMTPIVARVCADLNLSPKLMLMPMAMAVCTANFLIIGSSSNLIIQAMVEESGMDVELGFFELVKTNGPVSVLLLAFYIFATPLLLGDKADDAATAAAAADAVNAMSTSQVAPGAARIHAASISEALARKGTVGAHDTVIMLGVPATARDLVQAQAQTQEPTPATPAESAASPVVTFGTPSIPATSSTADDENVRHVPHRCIGKPLSEVLGHLPADLAAKVRIVGVCRSPQDPTTGTRAALDHAAEHAAGGGDAALYQWPTPSASSGFYDHVYDPDMPVQAHDVLVVAGRPAAIRNVRHLGPFAFVAVGVDAEAVKPTTNEDTPRSPDIYTTPQAASAAAAAAASASALPWTLPSALVALPPGKKRVPFVQVVVAENAFGVGQRLATLSFAGHYNCAVLSCRNQEGAHLYGAALAMHELEAGDSLLIRTKPDFIHAHANRPSTEFYVAEPIGFTLDSVLATRYIRIPHVVARVFGISSAADGAPTNKFARDHIEVRSGELYIRLPDWWPNLTLLVFFAVVTAAMANVDLVATCAVAIIAMVVLNLVTVKQAIGYVDFNVFVTGAMAFGIGAAMTKSGVAAWCGTLLLGAGLKGPWLVLTLAVLTSMIANVVTDRGSVQVVFPIAVAVVKAQNVSLLPYAVAVANAALGGVMTPFGLSTSLIISGPGGYVAKDFVLFGVPLLTVYTILSVSITCLVYGLW